MRSPSHISRHTCLVLPSLLLNEKQAVAAAGIIITNKDGDLTLLYPHSGHYRPGEADMQRCLLFLHRKGVDLRTFEIDIQQISHVSRTAAAAATAAATNNNSNNNNVTTSTSTSAPTPPASGGNAIAAGVSTDNPANSNNNKVLDKAQKKKKKVDNLQLEQAVIVACFLAHKARFIGSGIFSRIQQIRTSDATTVTEALQAVDYEGHWRKFSRLTL